MEKESNTKKKHEAHILGLQTSTFMSISLGGRASHLGRAPKLTKEKNQANSGGPVHLTKDFNSEELGSTLDSTLDSNWSPTTSGNFAGRCRIFVGLYWIQLYRIENIG